MIPRRTLVVALSLVVPACAGAVRAQSGGLVVTLGTDTVQAEQFTRQGARIEGVVASRIPSIRVVKYVATLDADGSLARYELETTTGDGVAVRTTATGGSMVFRGDTVFRETLANGQLTKQQIATPNGAVLGPTLPYVGAPFLLYEFAFAQARRLAKGANESAWYLLTMVPGQLQAQRQRVWLFGSDSAEADYFGVARSAYKFDAQGHLLRADWTGTTYKYLVARSPNVNAEAIARRWTANEKRGAGFGAASPRDTVRASVGVARVLVDYSRPAKRGRTIWGGLVPYDTIWRFGADFATHFTTSTNLTIGNVRVPAGTYTLWMWLSARGPTQLVISKSVNVFGTAYNPANDLARIPLERAQLRETIERLTIAVENDRLTAKWDDAAWSVPIVVGPADPPSPETLAAADRLMAETSTRQGLRAAVNNALAANGALLYPGAPVVHGTNQVAALLGAQPLLDSIIVRWQPLSTVISADATMGLTYGITVTLPRGVADAPPRMGNYAHVWKWSEPAGWRLVAAMHANVVPPQRTAVGTTDAIELAPLAASGPAGPFVAADLAFSRLATSADPATAFSSNAAADAVTIALTGELRRGPTEIGAPLIGNPPVDWSWHPVLAGASADGAFGFTVGESTSRPRGGTAPPGLSKYLSVWRREPDGTVKFVYDGGNTRPAPRSR